MQCIGLVAETYILSPNNLPIVNHIDGNKLNNNVKPVIRINEEKEIEYPSISEAARQLHITDGAIRYALKNNSKCCQSYWKYK